MRAFVTLRRRFMKTLLTWIFTGMALCGLSLAQDTTPPQSNSTGQQGQQNTTTTPSTQSSSAQAGGAPRIAPGSVIPVQLTKSIDAKKAKTGDAVEARVTQDLKTGNGELVVPKDTKVVGHVTEAQARTREQKESQVGIAFDHAVIKNGSSLTLPMSIQAIIAPPTSSPDSNNSGGGGATQQSSSSVPSTPGNSSGRSSGMGSGTQTQAPSPSGTASEGQTSAGANDRQPITGNTQGVVGISNLRLAMTSDATQGSLVSSEKNNVKLESGTFMLLRVNQ
jgi:hypothetical protein